MLHRHSLVLLAALAPVAFCARAVEVDSQFWGDVKVTARWSNRLDLIANASLRLDRPDAALERTSFQIGANVRATSWLTLTPTYQFIVNDPSEDAETREERPAVVAAMRVAMGCAEAIFSTGVEYRSRHDAADGWRIRPKLKLRRALGPERWGAAVYLAGELFYDTNADAWTRSRLFAGFEKKLTAAWSIDLYYCRQHDFTGSNPDLDIVGLQIGWRFDLRRSAVEK